MRDAHIHITGIVQGVGMRPFVYREAVARGIGGWVLNAGDGVHVEAHASNDAVLNAFVEALREHAPAAARIDAIEVRKTATANVASRPEANNMASMHRPESNEATATAQSATAFHIIASDDDTARTTLVSPDIATCPDCLRELFDPADRRYHYPFTNCTNCGPRFTIIRALPYDRATTSMAAFSLCPDCAAEYADPLDRRFHAQPDACFACGPHLTWRERAASAAAGATSATPPIGRTREASDAIIDRCAALLAAGDIVAIKGLGGFHLACNAGSEAAVRELRRRKRRSNKPLAVMVRSLDDARAVCKVHEGEAELLAGTVRPIVLLRRLADGPAAAGSATETDAATARTAPTAAPAEGARRAAHQTETPAPAPRPGSAPCIAPSVAGNLPELGIMLPYTPLQHLLLAACAAHGVTALVMTSGNVSEEPIEMDDGRAWAHLVETGIADALLGNDRAILARFDDSVVRVIDDTTQVVRRARGYAPRPIALPALAKRYRANDAHALDAPPSPPGILACGPEQKATIALTRELPDGTAACIVSPHIGDIEQAATFDAWHEARRRLEHLFDLHPAALACDMHPSYLSSQWARNHAADRGLPLVEVQHHHAHIASVIAGAAARGALAPDEAVVGIALDGTGAGTDGSIWGGEILVATLADYARAARLRPWRLPGGAASVRDARRNAYALLLSCGLEHHHGAAALRAELHPSERGLTETMVARGINSPLTSSCGRLLDALAALTGTCLNASYEGEPAIAFEAAAWGGVMCGEDDGTAANVLADDETRYRLDLAWHAAPEPDAETAARRARVNERALGELLEIDPSPLVTSILDDLAGGRDARAIARGAHDAIARAIAEAAADVAERADCRTVALSGGCFMNRLLFTQVCRLLSARGLTVLAPRELPVNDGCIAYGQAAIARARLAATERGATRDVA